MHCKSGADRVGIASSLYLIYKHKYNVLDASKQLSFKHLHIKYAKTGILDYLFETAIKKEKPHLLILSIGFILITIKKN